MNVKDEKKGITPSIPILSYAIVMLIWGAIMLNSYTIFQQSRNTLALAELNSLFPEFFILLSAALIVALFLFHRYIIGKYTYMFIITTFSIMLWYTPYILSGFVKQTDTIWHMGMAANYPAIIDGATMPFSSYVTSFPLSYAFNFIALEISGENLIVLANYVLPLIFTVLFTLFFFMIFSIYVNNHTAALASLLTIGLLHHISLHSSPEVIGFTVLLTALFFFNKNRLFISLGIGFCILPFIHIISFILFVCLIFLMYLKRYGFQYLLAGNKTGKGVIIKIASAFTIIIIFILVLFFRYIRSFFAKFSLGDTLAFTLNNLFFTSWFRVISSFTYISIFIVFSYLIFSGLKGKIKQREYKKLLLEIPENRFLLIVFPVAALFIGIIFAANSKSPVLIERGLFFFLPFASLVIFMLLGILYSSRRKKFLNGLIAIALVCVFLTYPLASYPIDSYNSFPVSEQKGLEFLTGNINVSGKSVHMSSAGQIDYYITPGTGVDMYPNRYNIYDLFIYRMSADYKVRLNDRHNPDSYKLIFESLSDNNTYDRIYYNPAFQIYQNNIRN